MWVWTLLDVCQTSPFSLQMDSNTGTSPGPLLGDSHLSVFLLLSETCPVIGPTRSFLPHPTLQRTDKVPTSPLLTPSSSGLFNFRILPILLLLLIAQSRLLKIPIPSHSSMKRIIINVLLPNLEEVVVYVNTYLSPFPSISRYYRLLLEKPREIGVGRRFWKGELSLTKHLLCFRHET